MYRNFTIDSATALGSSANGSAVRVDKASRFAIAAVVSSASSLDGTLKLQASLDKADVPASTSWADVTGASATLSADGVTIFDVSDKAWVWVRTVWTRTGGSGSMTTTFNENE